MWASKNPDEFFRNNFDLLRFSLATLVVFSHSYATLGLAEPLERVTSQLTFGTVAVNGFFIISGFLVSHSWTRSRGFTDFIRRRALRVYPGFFAVIALQAFVLAPIVAAKSWPFYHYGQGRHDCF